MSQTEVFALAMVIRPVMLVVVVLLTAYCVRRPLQKYMKEGRLKRILLKKIN